MARPRTLEAKSYRLTEISDCRWRLEPHGEMRVPGEIYGDLGIARALVAEIREGREWSALRQIRNVACLPGILRAALAMADVHPGYGFPIGGVGAFDPDEGVVMVAGVGFDVNCGVRTIRTPFTKGEVEARKEELAASLFRRIPAGVGSTGDLRLTVEEIDEVLLRGAEFALERGYGIAEDLDRIEEGGRMTGADPAAVSEVAKRRQHRQVGTLGSGNHYAEVQYVAEIHDEAAARAYGLERDGVVLSIHTGSRALGHQIGTDYLKVLKRASEKYGIPIRERELVGAPIASEEGRRYLSAVFAGMNCAFANRQALGHLARRAVRKVLPVEDADLPVLYDVAHNNVKFETHRLGAGTKRVLVHRKGATRALGPGHPDLPEAYRQVGQPVLVGGTMGTSSWILAGTPVGMDQTFGSAVHGAGRQLSRKAALRKYRGERVVRDLAAEGVLVRSRSKKGVAEEAPGAYKDVDAVVNSMERAGVSRKVARLRPLVCVKG